jgi:peptide/nickel transport system substrate-binding protein
MELAMKLHQVVMRAAGALALVTALATAVMSMPVAAKNFRFANQGDALSMDPHSLNESLQLNFLANIYEPLVGRGKKLELVPALATDWKQTAPTVWRFNLRKGVTFHDGAPFTADDVVFSYERAKDAGSDVKTYVGAIKEIRKLDSHTIDIITSEPFPILPDVISLWMIMSKKWCEDNRATQPVDKRKGVENTASFRANGTGPFRLRSREPSVRTVLQRNLNYWDKSIETNIDEATFKKVVQDAGEAANALWAAATLGLTSAAVVEPGRSEVQKRDAGAGKGVKLVPGVVESGEAAAASGV